MPFQPFSPVTSTNVVLTFHRVESATWFAAALETVGRFYRFVDADDLHAFLYAGRRLNGACHVTFDDGDRTFADVALPELTRRNIPASLFVAPDVLTGTRAYWFQELQHVRRHVDDAMIRRQLAVQLGRSPEALAGYTVAALFKTLPLTGMWQALDALEETHGLSPAPASNLTLAEVAALDQHPLVTIGAHSLTHPVLANETSDEAARQIAGSVAQLAARLGRPVRTFAYPNGAAGLDYNRREQALLRAAGVELAFTTDAGYVRQRSDPLALPRVGFSGTPGETPVWIATKVLLAPWWDRLRRNEENKQRRALRSRMSEPLP
ncbi:MAG: polysaccharide deacetylase family protein [Anaerolineae bacterium]